MVQRGGGWLEAVVERVNIPSPNAVRFPTLQRAGGFPCILRQCRPPVHPHPDGNLRSSRCACALAEGGKTISSAGRPSSARSSPRAIFGKEGGHSAFLHPPSPAIFIKAFCPPLRPTPGRSSSKSRSPERATVQSRARLTTHRSKAVLVSEAGYISGCPPSNGAITGTMRALYMKFASYCLWRIYQQLN
jgi:hypothetical protein